MNKCELVINPLDYIITLIQVEALAAEYYGVCLEVVSGEELHIEFDTQVNRTKFLEVIERTFKKKDIN